MLTNWLHSDVDFKLAQNDQVGQRHSNELHDIVSNVKY